MKSMKWILSIALTLWLVTIYANLACLDGNCPSGCPCLGKSSTAAPSDGKSDTTPSGKTNTPSNGTSELNSIRLTINFGNLATEKGRGIKGEFSIFSEKPSPTIFSPQMLQYLNPLLNRISRNLINYDFRGTIGLQYHVEVDENGEEMIAATTDEFYGGYSENQISTTLPANVTHQVQMIGPNREPLRFNFTTDQAIGQMTGKTAYLGYRMVMIGENGERVTRYPFYYDLYTGYGDFVRYNVETGFPVSYHTASGRVLKATDPSVGLEAIYDQDGTIRQIWSRSDGLADVVITEIGVSYEIRFYAPSQVGAKVDGVYTVSGSPYTVYRIEKPGGASASNAEVLLTRTVGGVDYQSFYRYSYASEGWTLYQPGELAMESFGTTYNYSNTVRTVDKVVKTLDGQVAKRSLDVYQKFDFGDRLMSTTLAPNGLALRSTFNYYTDAADSGSYGLVSTESLADGSWKSYRYNAQGWPVQVVSPWLNSQFNGAAADNVEVALGYTPHDSRDVIVEEDKRPRTTEVKILGQTASKEMRSYYFDGNSYCEIKEVATSPSAAWGDAANLRTMWRYYPKGDCTSASAGRLERITYPDWTTETYQYEYGNLQRDGSGNYTFSPGSGSAVREYVVYGHAASTTGVANRTTRTENFYDELGNHVYCGIQICTGNGYETASWTRWSYDEQHRILTELKSNGELAETTWNCCQKASETLPDGTTYTYTYDAMLRLVTKTKVGVNGQPDLVTTYTYNAASQVTSETVTGGSLSESTGREYNLAGLLIREVNKAGLATTFVYLGSVNSGSNLRGLQVTATLPGGATQVYAAYCDGQPQSLTGTAQTPVYYLYGVEADGRMWRQERTGGGDSPRRITAYLGMNKELQSVIRSGFGGDVSELFFYNAKNQLTKVTRTGSAPILMTYDELGKRSQTGLDVDNDGVLTPASDDRILAEEPLFESDNGWWKTLTRRTYATAGSGAATTLEVERTRLSGFAAGVSSELRRTDIHGNVTVETSTLDRAAKTRQDAVLRPDSAVAEVTEKLNGLRTMERTRDNLTTTYSYDGLARLIGVTEPRIGTSTLTYHTADGKKGLIATVTDAAGNTTGFDFNETGRLAWVKNALNKYTRYAYNNYGLVTRIWGDTQYPLEFTYDTLGQQIGMKTYRTGNDWNAVTWPENAPTGDLTTWMYDPASGLVTSKVDAALKAVNYTYTVDGKLATRTWARGIVTNYGYDPATGKLLTVDYADATPDITYTYNRLGQLATVADAAGTHTFSYDAALNRIGEAIAGIYAKNLNYTYANTGVKGRYTGFSLDNQSNSVYSYDSYGRLNQIDGLGGSFTYSRLADSVLLENLTRPNGVNTQWAYEAHRNLVTQVANGAASTFGYVNDAIGRRTSMSRSGSAFTTPDVLTYGYNDRNEVTSAASNNNAAYNYAYNYDPIGNRNTANLAGTSFQYTANALNQYTTVNTDTPTYDFDGNMLTNGAWTYTWNGENRMIAAVNGSTRLEFAYDYLGRRVEKKIYDGETLSKHTKFVYNGFKLVEELDALNSNATLRKYTWQPNAMLGLDVPLSIYDAALDTSYFYTTDANKNVSELLDSTGAIAAHYEYNPFGSQTVASGAYAATNPFRFSSEYFDAETGLVYYNYRFYSPVVGRWMSRDPIGELGGENLYGMVGNSPVQFRDSLGLGDWDDFVNMVRRAIAPRNVVNDDLDQLVDNLNDNSRVGGHLNSGTLDDEIVAQRAAEAAQSAMDTARTLCDPLDDGLTVWDFFHGKASYGDLALAAAPFGGFFKKGEKALKKVDDIVDNTKKIVRKAESPIWKNTKPYRGHTKTNGLTGKDKKYYEWDNTHNDIEVYDSKGRHLGSQDPISGEMTKPPVSGRTIDL